MICLTLIVLQILPFEQAPSYQACNFLYIRLVQTSSREYFPFLNFDELVIG